MFAAFQTVLEKLLRGRERPAPESSARLTEPDSETRLRSLREEELFFWQPTPLSWY